MKILLTSLLGILLTFALVQSDASRPPRDAQAKENGISAASAARSSGEMSSDMLPVSAARTAEASGEPSPSSSGRYESDSSTLAAPGRISGPASNVIEPASRPVEEAAVTGADLPGGRADEPTGSLKQR